MKNVRGFLTATLGVAGFMACLATQPALAQNTAWIAEPGTGSFSISFLNQNATNYFSKDVRTTDITGALQGGGNLAQRSVWLGFNYALHDAVALDIRTAWASSDVNCPNGCPNGGEDGYSGLYDSNIAVTFRVVDELVSNAPSVALRLGLIVAGRYDTGFINSLGDGGNGFEGSVIVGKFGDMAGFSGELGFRSRGGVDVNTAAPGGMGGGTVDVPSDMFANLSLFVPAGSRVVLGVDYRLNNATDGLDLGGEGFSPSRFPGVKEQAQIVNGRIVASLSDAVSASALFGQVVSGRNTARSRFFGVGLNFAFGGGFGGGL